MPRKQKYALVTGSSRGIGRGIALKLAEKGVNVAINYRENETAALETLSKVRDRGQMVLLFRLMLPTLKTTLGSFNVYSASSAN